MKTCSSCKFPRSIESFGILRSSPDGHSPTCKDCRNSYARTVPYDQARQIAYKKKYRDKMTPEQKRHWVLQSRASDARHPERHTARRKLQKAVEWGRIMKPKVCQDCGAESKIIHGHHEDYSKPFDVAWLCPLCHTERHKSK